MVYKSDLNYSTASIMFMLLFLRELVCVVFAVVHTRLTLCTERVCLAPGVAHQAADPACQSLNEGVARVAFAVEPFNLQQLPL